MSWLGQGNCSQTGMLHCTTKLKSINGDMAGTIHTAGLVGRGDGETIMALVVRMPWDPTSGRVHSWEPMLLFREARAAQ